VFHSSQPQVAAVDVNDTVHFRNVTIGRDEGNVIELQSGVASGEHLVLNLSNQIVEGQKVRISDEGAPRTISAARSP
jgi:hypothetical protein